MNPGVLEVFGNGIDDDCNPGTGDDGIPSFERVEVVTVPVTEGSFVISSTSLLQGVTYRLRASGSFIIGGPGNADAEYAFDGRSNTFVIDHCSADPTEVDFGIAIDDPEQFRRRRKQPFWGPFNVNHVYTIDFVGKGAPIRLNYQDCN